MQVIYAGHDGCLLRLGQLQAARLAAMEQRFEASLKVVYALHMYHT